MSMVIVRHGDEIKILEGELPNNRQVRVFTEDEVLQFEGWKQWMSLTQEQRDDLLIQNQSVEYQKWMEENDWDECCVQDPPHHYGDSK